MTDPTFTAEDALEVTSALRRELGLTPEQFLPQAFIGMISDEIEQLRAQGKDDTMIAAMVAKLTGKPVTAGLIKRHYAEPEERGHRGAE